MLYPEMLARPVMITNSRGMSADTIGRARGCGDDGAVQADCRWQSGGRCNMTGRRTRSARRRAIAPSPAPACSSSVSVRSARRPRHRLAGLGADVSAIRRTVAAGAPDWRTRAGGPRSPARAVAPGGHRGDLCAADLPHATHHRHGRAVSDASGRHSRQRQPREAGRPVRARGGVAGRCDCGRRPRRLRARAARSPSARCGISPNVLITPHTSGFRVDHWDAATALFAENLRRFDSGAPLVNVVDKEAGY